MPQPRLYRRSEGKLVAGVAGGLADHLGLNPLVVRVAFVALTPVNGLGAVLYAVFWAAVRQVSPAQDRPPPNARQRAEASGQLVAFAAIAAGLLLFLPRIGLGGNSLLAWPVAAAVVGGALIWRQADESAQVRWERLVGGQGANRRDAVLRIAIGVVLVAGGLISALAATGNLVAARDGLLTTGVMVAGVAVVTGPWWWRTWQDLATERRERIRSQERADLAAHVHDSVLHTLALIQRHVEDPREVTRLARGQERELRGWLYRPTGSPDSRLAAAIETAAAEVEDTYGVSVEPVVVGDCPVDERLTALVRASREALVNAARHAGVTQISLYAEVELEQVTVFIRDRGSGFDPAGVSADRHGVAGSIVGRMERHGGSADVRSSPAAGTEVRLSMARETG